MGDPRRAVPRTDVLLGDPRLHRLSEQLGRAVVRDAVHVAQDRCRRDLIAPDEVVQDAVQALGQRPLGLRRVLNATGVIVHTNLGRAPLSPVAVQAVVLAAGTTDLELDLQTGRRGRRGDNALQALADAVPDADDVHVVNNGAAALALVTAALATGREVVVARGEMVEIGDGFRIPELLESAGARLREVGTTNRVRLDDYAAAVGAETGLVLKVHPSNFVVSGFTASVDVAALATLPVPVVCDIGSGLLTPHPRLPAEPDAASSLRAGAAVVTASGDKLLGGPQCGLVLGHRDLVQRVRRHPLARAMRVDKLTLAGLAATLTGPTPPVPATLQASLDDLERRAERLCGELTSSVAAEAVASTAAVGGGGAPGVRLPSVAVAVPVELATRLRTGSPAVVGHVERERLLLDLIAVDPADDVLLADCIRRAAKG